MTTENIVKQIIVDHFGVNDADVTLTSHLAGDLGADSLDTVELLMAVEDEFNIEIPDSEEWKLNTIQDIVNYIEKK